MRLRRARRATFHLRDPSQINGLILRVLVYWRLPCVEVELASLPRSLAERAQLKLRHLHALSERKSGAVVAFLTLMAGLAGMLWTYNRNLRYMALLVPAAIVASLAWRLLVGALIRARMVVALLLLRGRERRARAAVPEEAKRADSVASAEPYVPLRLQRTWSSSVEGVRQRYEGGSSPRALALLAIVPVADIESWKRIYRDLGFEQTSESADTCAMQVNGQAFILKKVADAAHAGPAVELELHVDDVDAWSQRVHEARRRHPQLQVAGPGAEQSRRVMSFGDAAGVRWHLVAGEAR